MVVARLEIVTQSELHNAIGVGLGRDVPKGAVVEICGRIGKVSVVKRVVSLGAELESMLFRPGHEESLPERHVKIDEAGTAQIVAVSDLTWQRIAEGGTGGGLIGEILNRAVGVGMNMAGQG